MHNSNLNVSSVTTLLSPVFKKHHVRRAVLFGSVAKGTNQLNSDIDILVDSNLKGLRFIGLLEDVQEVIQRDVDLLDVSHITKGSLVEREINETGVVIYEE